MSNLDLSKITANGTTLSGNVTLNINVEDTTKETTLDDALIIIAKEVLKGTYGNGDDRKTAIYKAVQEKVNELNT